MLKFFRWSLRHSASSLLVSAAPTCLPLLFSYLILALFSPLCPLLHFFFYLNLWQELFSLSSRSIKLQWIHGHLFLSSNDAADKLTRWGALLVPSAIPLQSLFSYLSYPLFSFFWTEGVMSRLNSSTHRFPRFPSRNLCFCVMLAVFSLVFAAATDTVFC